MFEGSTRRGMIARKVVSDTFPCMRLMFLAGVQFSKNPATEEEKRETTRTEDDESSIEEASSKAWKPTSS